MIYRKTSRVTLVKGWPCSSIVPSFFQYLKPRRLYIYHVRLCLRSSKHLQRLVMRIQQTHVSGVYQRAHAFRTGAVQVPFIFPVFYELASLDLLLHLFTANEVILLPVDFACSRLSRGIWTAPRKSILNDFDESEKKKKAVLDENNDWNKRDRRKLTRDRCLVLIGVGGHEPPLELVPSDTGWPDQNHRSVETRSWIEFCDLFVGRYFFPVEIVVLCSVIHDFFSFYSLQVALCRRGV